MIKKLILTFIFIFSFLIGYSQFAQGADGYKLEKYKLEKFSTKTTNVFVKTLDNKLNFYVTGNCIIYLYDMFGRSIIEKYISRSLFFSKTEMRHGIYQVRIIDSGGSYNKKIVI